MVVQQAGNTHTMAVVAHPADEAPADDGRTFNTPQGRFTEDEFFDLCDGLFYLRYDVDAPAVLSFRDEVKALAPHLVAWNGKHIFMSGDDGVVRRFPPVPDSNLRDWPEPLRYAPDTAALSELVIDKGKAVFDFSGPGSEARRVAGFEVEEASQTMSYKVAGTPIPSLLEKQGLYPLGAGPSGESQYMVVQAKLNEDNGPQCLSMLLCEGKDQAAAKALLASGVRGSVSFDPDPTPAARISNELQDVLVGMSLSGKPYDVGMQALARELEKRGSCMLKLQAFNHWIMLDSLERAGHDSWTYRVRSPLHGTVVEGRIAPAASAPPLSGKAPFGGWADDRTPPGTFGARDIDLLGGVQSPLLTDAVLAVFRAAHLPASRPAAVPEAVSAIRV